MDSAIHIPTGKITMSYEVFDHGRFIGKKHKKGLWRALSSEIENYEDVDENDLLVTPVKPYRREGKNYIPALFRLYPGKGSKIIFKGETEIHKQAKTTLITLLSKTFDCKLRYDKDVFPMKDIPVDHKRIKKDLKMDEVTKHIQTSTKEWHKRADALIPLKFHPFWGRGIVIEIRVTEGDENVEGKETFWFSCGYSIIWVGADQLCEHEGRLGLNTNILDVIPYSIGYGKIAQERENRQLGYLQEMYVLIDEVKDKTRDIFEMIKEAPKRTCRVCSHGTEDNRYEGMVACWYEKNHGKSNHPDIHEPLDSCEHWKRKGGKHD